MARYLDARTGGGASIATLRMDAAAIGKAHEWAGHDSLYWDQGVREPLKGWGRSLAKPQRHAGALTVDVQGIIRLAASRSRRLGRGLETLRQAAARARVDLALVSVLSDAGLRRSETAVSTWGGVVRWDDGSGRITVVRSKTDADAVVAITRVTMRALDAGRPVGVGSGERVFGLSASQITRRVKAVAKAAGPAGWESFSGAQRAGGHDPPRMAQNGAPTHEIERQGRWKQGGGMVGRYTRGESAGSALRYL